MEVVRAPLPQVEYDTILTEYNRLTLAAIPMNEFMRWVTNSPAGPAWHAVLKSEAGEVVGHTSVLPIYVQYRGNKQVSGMSEYSFVHEDFRKQKIRGFENVSRPPFIILLDHLFQHCIREGWGPIFASTNEKNQVFTRKVGLRPAEFPLKECLLVLKPIAASRHTPNLSAKQRAALYTAGIVQKGLWSIGKCLLGRTNGAHEADISSWPAQPPDERMAFYEEPKSISWRYLGGQYVRYRFDNQPHDYVITKRGSGDRYVRVCQYRLSSEVSVSAAVRALVREAEEEGAIGVRWAVYDNNDLAKEIVKKLRLFGFLCADRVRIVMVHKDFTEYLQPSVWTMNDTHFCLDP
jgi:hypothetical protein